MNDVLAKVLYSFNYVLERDIAGRAFYVEPDDVFLVSYPKSGNTWTRFLLGNLTSPDEQVTFANVERKVPDIYAKSRKALKRIPRPRLIKSHECFDPRYRRVVYIVRDPRDVAVSAYHYDRKGKNIADDFPVNQYVEARFMKTDEYFGTWGEHAGSWMVNSKNIFQLGRLKNSFLGTPASWGENVMSWLGAVGHDRKFLLVRYEDLLEDAHREMARIAEFLHLNATPERIARAVELSSAENMRKLESQENKIWVTTRESRKDIPFVRAAKSGEWRRTLPPESVAMIEEAWGPVMKLLGYPLSREVKQPDEVLAERS
ncbi:MAG TPA: sulfotransferase domain-containing protein [Candidatus Binatia bacterium]|nr:sulfotransferase domain-containing protein [Candidatus Binatia bacterium]